MKMVPNIRHIAGLSLSLLLYLVWPEPEVANDDAIKDNEQAKYEALCRGEIEISSDIAKRLKCRYLTENHPFLRLAPIKVEQMYISPDVFMFHEVISDAEIQLFQQLAMPRLERALVIDAKTGERVLSNNRICKSASLREEEPVVARVSRRITHITGLSVASADLLNVVQYGVGGHYEPHYDFSRKGEKGVANLNGNRIATVLFYLSEVAQGGATVFPVLGLSVFPVKNAALFWMNLYPSGEGDMASKHAGCPVLTGSKWVCTKWLRQAGQEFLKPCNLDYQAEGIHWKIPPAVLKSSR